VCFFFSDSILHVLKGPAGASFQINAFGPMDGFAIKWKVALYAGLSWRRPTGSTSLWPSSLPASARASGVF